MSSAVTDPSGLGLMPLAPSPSFIHRRDGGGGGGQPKQVALSLPGEQDQLPISAAGASALIVALYAAGSPISQIVIDDLADGVPLLFSCYNQTAANASLSVRVNPGNAQLLWQREGQAPNQYFPSVAAGRLVVATGVSASPYKPLPDSTLVVRGCLVVVISAVT